MRKSPSWRGCMHGIVTCVLYGQTTFRMFDLRNSCIDPVGVTINYLGSSYGSVVLPQLRFHG